MPTLAHQPRWIPNLASFILEAQLKVGFLISNADEAGSGRAHLQDHESIVGFDSSDPHIAMKDPGAL